MINITGVDLKQFVAEVYNLSKPQGLGYIHYKKGPLDNETIEKIIDSPHYVDCIINMDYVHGRACKINVYEKDDQWFIDNQWFDHTPEDLKELLRRCGIDQ